MASNSWRDIKGKEVEEKQQEKITKEKEEKRLKVKDDSERLLSSELAFKAWYVFYKTCHIYRPSFRENLLRGRLTCCFPGASTLPPSSLPPPPNKTLM